MGWRIKGELKGLKEAAAALDGFKARIQKKILRRAVTAASRIVLRAVKSAETRRRSGQLRKSLGMKVKTYGDGRVVGIVGPRRGFDLMYRGRKINPVYYARLVEGGVKPHHLGKGSSQRKKVQTGAMHPGFQGIRFMARGWKRAEDQARQKATDLIADGVQQEAAKAAA